MNIIKKHWKISVVVSVVLIAALILCLVPVKLQAADIKTPEGKRSKTSELSLTEHELAPAGMQAVTENESLILFLDKTDASVSVYDKHTGIYWNSNPTDEQIETSNTISNVKNEMSSQLVFTYYDEKGVQLFYDTYTHAIKEETVEYAAIENGLAVTYTVGENEITVNMIPSAVEKDKFDEKVLKYLTEDEKKTVLKYYELEEIGKLTGVKKTQFEKRYPSASENKEYYFLAKNTPVYKVAEIYKAIFGDTEYTSDDVDKDNTAVGFETEADPYYNVVITIEYTLEGANLKVRIPMADTQISDDMNLTDIEVLPFFGNAGTSDQGYMFVPDGSGGIINFNNRRTQSPDLQVHIYGNADTNQQEAKNMSAATAQLPVYGMVKNNNAFLAVIEQGEEIGSIWSRVSGKETNINQVYPAFNILTQSFMKARGVTTALYPEEHYKGDITINYMFYGSEGASYSALARNYRSYLLEKGLLTETASDYSMYVSLTGKIKSKNNFLGISYSTEETITSFDQAQIIAEKLKDNGVDNINMAFSSWFGGGIATDIPVNASPASGMGGKKALSALAEELGAETNVILGASVQKIWKGMPTFNSIKYACRNLTNKSIIGYGYNVATNVADEEGATYFTLSPKYLESMIEKYTDSVAKLGGHSVWLDDAGDLIMADLRNRAQLDETAAKYYITQALKNIPEDKNVVITNPNLYAMINTDTALSVPMKSSENYLINRSVPFLQMVISGCIDYTAPSINGVGAADEQILKAVETGSMLHFDWIYASDDSVALMSGDESDSMFSKNYENWLGIATEAYTRIESELVPIASGVIISHEQVATDVYRTDWEKGSVLVNYSSNDVTVDGVKVGAKDFKVIK